MGCGASRPLQQSVAFAQVDMATQSVSEVEAVEVGGGQVPPPTLEPATAPPRFELSDSLETAARATTAAPVPDAPRHLTRHSLVCCNPQQLQGAMGPFRSVMFTPPLPPPAAASSLDGGSGITAAIAALPQDAFASPLRPPASAMLLQASLPTSASLWAGMDVVPQEQSIMQSEMRNGSNATVLNAEERGSINRSVVLAIFPTQAPTSPPVASQQRIMQGTDGSTNGVGAASLCSNDGWRQLRPGGGGSVASPQSEEAAADVVSYGDAASARFTFSGIPCLATESFKSHSTTTTATTVTTTTTVSGCGLRDLRDQDGADGELVEKVRVSGNGITGEAGGVLGFGSVGYAGSGGVRTPRGVGTSAVMQSRKPPTTATSSSSSSSSRASAVATMRPVSHLI